MVSRTPIELVDLLGLPMGSPYLVLFRASWVKIFFWYLHGVHVFWIEPKEFATFKYVACSKLERRAKHKAIYLKYIVIKCKTVFRQFIHIYWTLKAIVNLLGYEKYVIILNENTYHVILYCLFHLRKTVSF